MSKEVGAWEDITDQALLAAYERYGSIRRLIEATGWTVSKTTIWRRLRDLPGYEPQPQAPSRAEVSTNRLRRMRYQDRMTLSGIAQILEREGVKITPSGICKRLEREDTTQKERA